MRTLCAVLQRKTESRQIGKRSNCGSPTNTAPPINIQKSHLPAGDWIPRLTPCTQCGKPNDHTSNHLCAQCSRKAHKACIMERKKLTKSQTFFCITCFKIDTPTEGLDIYVWSVETQARSKQTNTALPVLALPSYTKHVRRQ